MYSSCLKCLSLYPASCLRSEFPLYSWFVGVCLCSSGVIIFWFTYCLSVLYAFCPVGDAAMKTPATIGSKSFASPSPVFLCASSSRFILIQPNLITTTQ